MPECGDGLQISRHPHAPLQTRMDTATRVLAISARSTDLNRSQGLSLMQLPLRYSDIIGQERAVASLTAFSEFYRLNHRTAEHVLIVADDGMGPECCICGDNEAVALFSQKHPRELLQGNVRIALRSVENVDESAGPRWPQYTHEISSQGRARRGAMAPVCLCGTFAPGRRRIAPRGLRNRRISGRICGMCVGRGLARFLDFSRSRARNILRTSKRTPLTNLVEPQLGSLSRPPYFFCSPIESNSTSKIRVAPGPMSPPAPRSP